MWRIHLLGLGLDRTTTNVQITELTISSEIRSSRSELWNFSKLVTELVTDNLYLQSAGKPLINTNIMELSIKLRHDLSIEISDWEIVTERCCPLK